MEVVIDVTDWEDEVKRSEDFIDSDDELFRLVEKGKKTGEIAKSIIISRQSGIAPDDIIRPDKVLYLVGAMTDVHQKVVRQKHKVTTESGANYESRSYVGAVKDEDEEKPDGDGDFYISSHSSEAIIRANKYLDNVAPGHIWNRLLIIYENEGDVEQAADEFKAKIDKMVERLK